MKDMVNLLGKTMFMACDDKLPESNGELRPESKIPLRGRLGKKEEHISPIKLLFLGDYKSLAIPFNVIWLLTTCHLLFQWELEEFFNVPLHVFSYLLCYSVIGQLLLTSVVSD